MVEIARASQAQSPSSEQAQPAGATSIQRSDRQCIDARGVSQTAEVDSQRSTVHPLWRGAAYALDLAYEQLPVRLSVVGDVASLVRQAYDYVTEVPVPDDPVQMRSELGRLSDIASEGLARETAVHKRLAHCSTWDEVGQSVALGTIDKAIGALTGDAAKLATWDAVFELTASWHEALQAPIMASLTQALCTLSDHEAMVARGDLVFARTETWGGPNVAPVLGNLSGVYGWHAQDGKRILALHVRAKALDGAMRSTFTHRMLQSSKCLDEQALAEVLRDVFAWTKTLSFEERFAFFKPMHGEVVTRAGERESWQAAYADLVAEAHPWFVRDFGGHPKTLKLCASHEQHWTYGRSLGT